MSIPFIFLREGLGENLEFCFFSTGHGMGVSLGGGLDINTVVFRLC